MKNLIPTICFLAGIACGFYPGTWKGQLIAMQASAPGIDPSYASALSDDAVYRARAPMAVKR